MDLVSLEGVEMSSVLFPPPPPLLWFSVFEKECMLEPAANLDR